MLFCDTMSRGSKDVMAIKVCGGKMVNREKRKCPQDRYIVLEIEKGEGPYGEDNPCCFGTCIVAKPGEYTGREYNYGFRGPFWLVGCVINTSNMTIDMVLDSLISHDEAAELLKLFHQEQKEIKQRDTFEKEIHEQQDPDKVLQSAVRHIMDYYCRKDMDAADIFDELRFKKEDEDNYTSPLPFINTFPISVLDNAIRKAQDALNDALQESCDESWEI